MDPLEHEARKHHLNYIRLTGNVGAMVNGAGLAMATMDLIKAAGADPANFLDVGGGASAEMVANGFRIILGDPNVKGVLINIFGGILRCNMLANGVVEAVKQVKVQVPIIVRLEANVEQGREILANPASPSPWPATCWTQRSKWRRWSRKEIEDVGRRQGVFAQRLFALPAPPNPHKGCLPRSAEESRWISPNSTLLLTP